MSAPSSPRPASPFLDVTTTPTEEFSLLPLDEFPLGEEAPHAYLDLHPDVFAPLDACGLAGGLPSDDGDESDDFLELYETVGGGSEGSRGGAGLFE